MPKTRFESEDEGVDVIIDCTGVPAALEHALQWTKMGATVMIFGCAPIGQFCLQEGICEIPVPKLVSDKKDFEILVRAWI